MDLILVACNTQGVMCRLQSSLFLFDWWGRGGPLGNQSEDGDTFGTC